MAARLPRGGSLIVAACLLIAAGLTLAVPRVHSNVALFICIGIISGLPGAAVMSLPSRVLDVPTRAVGMLFYSVYYGIMLVFPTAQGMLAQGTNSAAVTFDLAACRYWARYLCSRSSRLWLADRLGSSRWRPRKCDVDSGAQLSLFGAQDLLTRRLVPRGSLRARPPLVSPWSFSFPCHPIRITC
jgi:hypothetical protein